jgi:YggT family protein
MSREPIVFVLETFLGLFAVALLVRFYLQLMRAPARNPVSTFVAALTDWIVVPTRRVLPGLFGIDLSTLVLAWLTELMLLAATAAVRSYDLGLPVLGWLALVAAIQLVKLSLFILMGAVLIQAILSWVAPYSPAMPILNSLTRPFLRIFQRRIPPVGNVDLSPLFVLVGCQLLLYLIAYLERGLS